MLSLSILSLFENIFCLVGKVITAAYVPVTNYHNLFPDADRDKARR